jgi:tRNA pseudouridine55 synthase
LLVDKPQGLTSHDVVAEVRRVLRTRRVGHTGTLDPFATGLLLVLVGRATRLARFLSDLPKRYVGVIELGTTTTTDDPTGEVTGRSDAWKTLTDEEIRVSLTGFEGRYAQRPPAFSAKKVSGMRAHRRARRGEEVELSAQPVDVLHLVLTEREGCCVRVAAEVGRGTYLRAIARDVGEVLGCGAHLRALRRTGIGSYSVDGALQIPGLREESLVLRSPLEAVGHLPTLEVDGTDREQVVHGRAVSAANLPGGPVAVLAGGTLLAIAEPEGDVLKPRVVLAG